MNWYVIKVLNNKEKKIKENIETELKRNNAENIISNFLIPFQDTFQMRNNKKVKVEKNLYPGYIFIQCASITEVESNIKRIDGVQSILKQPIKEFEIDRIIGKEKKTVDEKFHINQKVKIVDGPFSSFNGTIKDIDNNKEKVKVTISIFDRETILDLNFTQVVNLID